MSKQRTKKYNHRKHVINPYIDFRHEIVSKNNLMPFYNQIFWTMSELKLGKSISPVPVKIGDEDFCHLIALKRVFLESYAVVELLRERNILNPSLVENINWMRDRINDIFAKVLEFVKFDDDGIEYWIHTDFSYKPKPATIERMSAIVSLMYVFWLDNVRNHERAAAMWNGCLYMGVYLENENKSLHKLLKFDGFKKELERIFISQRYLE